jgi:hypothetical protein
MTGNKGKAIYFSSEVVMGFAVVLVIKNFYILQYFNVY